MPFPSSETHKEPSTIDLSVNMTEDCNTDEMAINSTDDHQNVSIGTLDTTVPLDQAESEPITNHITTESKYTQTPTNLPAAKNNPMLPHVHV